MQRKKKKPARQNNPLQHYIKYTYFYEKTMERKLNEPLVLNLHDREECDYIIYSLQKLPQWTANVDKVKLASLVANLKVIKQSLPKR